MVRHIVAWNYAEGLSLEERKNRAEQMKKELEDLKNLIPGILSIQLLIQPLDTSDSDLLLDSIFVDEKALKEYIVHPEHVRVGTNYVKPYVTNRKCIDMSMD